MRLNFALVLGLVISAATLPSSARAQNKTAVYVITYVDVMPNAAASGAALLEGYRDVARKENGNLRFDVLQEIARPNRFAMVQVWADDGAREAHANAAMTGAFGEKLKAIENAPPDVRLNGGLFVEPAKSKSPPGAVYVVTHVDVVPPSKDTCISLLQAMSVDTPKDPGNISYEVLQQASRPNHFTVVEAWANRKALDAHAMAEHTRAFRNKLLPMGGALYDERFYKLLR
jgi:quinol monooxygenase YgiN